MNRQAYLQRINYTGPLNPTLDVLSALQQAHLFNVPFENLDIHSGRTIRLELPLLYKKIVGMGRGGFCYELNGLFNWLLKDLGFEVSLAMGRVYDRTNQTYGPEFDHLLNLVSISEETWIVDVGYGDFSLHPLPVTFDQPLADPCGRFLVEDGADGYFRVSRFSDGNYRYVPEYVFSTLRRKLTDFSVMCEYHQSSPESHFTRKRICSLATPTGRITLTDGKLIVTDNGMKKESEVRDETEFVHLLARYFNINSP